MTTNGNKGSLPFTKVDYVAILLRLEPSYNNAMMASFSVDSLRHEIRNVVYNSPMEQLEGQ